MPEHTLTPTPGGEFDFHPQFPDAEPAATESGKVSKSIPEAKINPRLIDILDFMDPIQHSPDMIQFAEPFSNQLNWIREWAWLLRDLPRFDKLPQKFLSHLAGTFGFELIDMPFATESERRQLIKWIIPIYQRRGTLWAVRKIIEVLGFTVEFEEEYRVTGIWDRHKFWSPSAIAESYRAFDWNDGTMQGVTNESNGDFAPLAGKLRGKAASGAPFDMSTSATFSDTESRETYTSIKFRVVNSGDCFFGVILRWESSSRVLLATLSKSGASEYLIVYGYINSVWNNLGQANISQFNWLSGDHELVVWDTGEKLTIILDDTTLMYQVNYFAAFEPVKKGLYVKDGTEVDFDDYVIRAIDRKKQPKFFAPGIFDKTLGITLSGSPTHSAAKTEYLQKIIPAFVPIDTTIQWH